MFIVLFLTLFGFHWIPILGKGIDSADKNRFYLSGPVAGLAVQVKDESGWASDRGQGVATLEVVLDAADRVSAVGLGRQPEVLLVGPILTKLFNDFL